MRTKKNSSSQPTVGSDRRCEKRHATNLLSCVVGDVVDVSASGMKLRCQSKPPVKVGQVVDTKLNSGTQRIAVQAQILWIKRRGLRSYTLGVQFVNIKSGLKRAIESLALFGYVDLEAAAKNNCKQRIAAEANVKPNSGNHGKAENKVNDSRCDPKDAHESGDKQPKPTIKATLDLPDYYAILGVRVDASKLEIKAAFYKLARKYHPDCANSDVHVAKFTHASQAYQVLRDSKCRRTYDQQRVA
jgi:hypothetical protein